jgi:nicotinate-nucleotide adenylyltransferase
MAHRLLYGGTFDPVHHGHLIPCRHARELLNADSVTLLPARISPHKSATVSASADHRLAMLHLAIAGENGFAIDPRELTRPGPSFTIDTVRDLTATSADTFTLLIGADQLKLFATWREVQEILRLVKVAVLARPGADLHAGLELAYATLGAPGRERLTPLETPLIEISATAIRQRAALGQSIRYLVPDAVAEYMVKHQLYQTPMSSAGTSTLKPS